MKIGIIVYSQTGNTYSVAKKLYDKLLAEKHLVSIEKVEASRSTKQGEQIFELKKKPDVKEFDFIIFASFVEAFSLCPVMKKYLNDIKNLNEKKVVCLVTQFFPYAWMGGNNAIKQMAKICEEKGAIISQTSIINWKNKKREEIINNFVNSSNDFLGGK